MSGMGSHKNQLLDELLANKSEEYRKGFYDCISYLHEFLEIQCGGRPGEAAKAFNTVYESVVERESFTDYLNEHLEV